MKKTNDFLSLMDKDKNLKLNEVYQLYGNLVYMAAASVELLKLSGLEHTVHYKNAVAYHKGLLAVSD